MQDRDKVNEFLSFLSVFFLLILMINASIRLTYQTLFMKDYSMYLYINGGLGLLLYVISKIRNFKFNKYEIIVFIMIILSCLSLLNAVNINDAIFGKINRYEGLLVWLTYYITILNAIKIKNKKYLYIIVSLISFYTISNIFYGLYQVGIFKPHFFTLYNAWHYARGFLGNSMGFGTLTCIFYGIVLGLFIKIDIGIKKYLLAILLLLANLGIIMSGAMSSIVAIIVVNMICLIEIIVLIIKKEKKCYMYLCSFIIGALSFVLVFILYTNNYSLIKDDILKTVNQAQNTIETGKMEDNYGSNRIYIWRNAIQKMKEAPITGYGIDNFRNAFDSKLIISSGIVDKAHNDYLQKAFCEGIISGLVFIAFLLIIFFKGIFNKLTPMYYGLLLAFTCYSVQAFFNISVTRVAPIYFIVIGLLIGKIRQIEKNKLNIKCQK